MIVRVPDIPTEGLSVTDAPALGGVYRDPAWRLLDVNLRLERDGADVFVTGEVHAAVSQACGRCLEPSPAEVTATLDVRLVPRPSTADNVELAPDDLDVDFYDRDEIEDRKSTRLNSSHVAISYAVFCLKKKKKNTTT